MATTVKRRPKGVTARKRASQHRKTERAVAQHRENMIAKAVPVEQLPNCDPAQTLQLLINRVERQWRYAAAQVDALRPGVATNQSGESMDHELWVTWDDNSNLVVTSSYWIQREMELSKLLGELTDRSIRVGLADRIAKVKESEVRLLGEALREAAQDCGLSESQQRALGSALRNRLQLVQGDDGGQYEPVDAEVVAA